MYKVFSNNNNNNINNNNNNTNNNNKWDYLLTYSDLSCQMVMYSSLFLHKKKSLDKIVLMLN
jgi:hypothetical protein